MDWSLTVAELRNNINGLKRGDRHISWKRDVPIDDLIDFPLDDGTTIKSVEYVKALESILVQVPGYIMDAGVNRELLNSLGCETIQAEVFYKREWLIESEAGQSKGTHPADRGMRVSRGITPEPTEGQRKSMKLLADRLRKHGEDYPVHITHPFFN